MGDLHEVSAISSYTTLQIGIAVAVPVFVVFTILVFRYFTKKGRDRSFYSQARSSDVRPQFFKELEKKSLQPDLMQHSDGPPCYEYPPFLTKQTNHGLPSNVSEHHYDVPHLSNSYASPIDIKHQPLNESEHYDKKPYVSESENSTASCCTSSDSTCEAGMSLPLSPCPASHAACSASHVAGTAGVRLELPACGVALHVPPGAVNDARQETVSVTMVRDERFRPRLPEGVTQVSPVIRLLPATLQLSKAVILQLPHCASLKHGFWNLSLFAMDRETTIKPDKNPPAWRNIVSLGQETINTPIFTQLDPDKIFLVSDRLTSFVLVGESLNGRAVKKLQLAVFGPKVEARSSTDMNIRVYIFEDTPGALFYCADQENRLGGVLMSKPKSLLFQDGGSNLCLSLEGLGLGWKTKPGTSYQEIPFSHIWNSTSNSLHCSFILEQTDSINILEFTVIACQKLNPSHRQTFEIKSGDDFSNCNSPLRSTRRTYLTNDLNLIISENALESKTLPGRGFAIVDEYSEASRQKSLTVNDRGINTCIVDSSSNFRLPKNVRKQLCACLDPPNSRGNDWRLLAQKLNVDRYINFFATKNSPTESILDLWECRHRNTSALADLATILKCMGRTDALRAIESCLGPSWL